MSLIQRVTALAQAVAADIKALYADKAEKEHTHTINDVTGLATRLGGIDSLIGDVESVLIAINGEP